MKTFVIILLGMFLSVVAFSQTEKEKSIHIDVDEVKVVPPKFTGIPNAFPFSDQIERHSIQEYMTRNIVCPKEDVSCVTQGTEVVQFTVKSTGELTDFKVINSLSEEIDAEVIRVLKTTAGMWIPGYNNDEIVEMEKEVAIMFKMDGTNERVLKAMAEKYFTKGSTVFLVEKKPKKSLKHYDKAIVLYPNDGGLLLLRGMARYESGDKEGAYRDWNRFKKVGHAYDTEYLTQLKDMSGYAELVNIFQE